MVHNLILSTNKCFWYNFDLAFCIFFPYVELETKRILLDIFKEKQQKSAEAGTIPSFYKKACIRTVNWWGTKYEGLALLP